MSELSQMVQVVRVWPQDQDGQAAEEEVDEEEE